MKASWLFTDAELIAIECRRQGLKADPSGIFHSRVKPKIVELLRLFQHREELRRLIRRDKTNR
jgi:hypothetical protein